MIEAKNVTKKYGKGQNIFTALESVNLKLNEGEVVALIGKSGSGKSTLLHTLVGLDTSTSGIIEFNGQDLKSMDLDKWRGKNIGIVFQQFFLQLQDKVVDNVALPLKLQNVSKQDRRDKALEALAKVGLSDKSANRANDLSGGQKQRVAIARAIVTNPSLLIADEPTGNLDTESGDLVMETLLKLNKDLKTTLLIVTHDADIAKRCQRVVTISDGKIVSDKKTAAKRSKK